MQNHAIPDSTFRCGVLLEVSISNVSKLANSISRALPATKNPVKLLKSPITDFWLAQNEPAGNNYDCATVRDRFYLCDYLSSLHSLWLLNLEEIGMRKGVTIAVYYHGRASYRLKECISNFPSA